MNEEPKVGHPYPTRNCYDELLPIPNSDAGGAHERFLPREDCGIS
jgi:hypothetical protein